MNRLFILIAASISWSATALAGAAGQVGSSFDPERPVICVQPTTNSATASDSASDSASDAASKAATEALDRKKALLVLAKTSSPDGALKQLQENAAGMLVEAQFATAHAGLEGAAGAAVAETLQILGQIVADRASAEAYSLIKKKLEAALVCNPKDAQEKVKAALFTNTCTVLKPLRIQEVATSGTALQAALMNDILTLALKDSALAFHYTRVLQSDLLPLVVSGRDPNPQTVNTLVRDLIGIGLLAALRDGSASFCQAGKDRALTLASISVLQCKAAVVAGENKASIGDCDVGLLVENLVAGANCGKKPLTEEERAIAHVFASNMLAALTPDTSDSQTRARLGQTTALFFEAACVHEGLNYCAELARSDSTDLMRFGNAMLLTRDAITSAIERDSNALVATGWRALAAAGKEIPENADKGLRLVGGLLQYTATYEPVKTADTKDIDYLHERRTKILESLTEEMTNRTGRDDDFIWSFGGSLRASAGIRTMRNDFAFFGPLSLPLGLSFQSKGKNGFHLELSAIDLGQYLSFNKGFEVAKPEVAQVLAPSVTIGAFFSKDFPVIVGASVGFSPQYQFTENGKRGAFSAGVVAGVYVPLLDLN